MPNEFRDIDKIDLDLLRLAEEEALQDHRYEQIQNQIRELREQLRTMSVQRSTLNHKRRELNRERESATRQKALEDEQQQLEQNLLLAREKAEALVASAPWRNGSLPGGEEIFGWQLDGAIKLANARRGILADSRGMGKTLTALAWRRLVQSRRTLVLTKKSVAAEFVKEANFWEPELMVFPILGADDDRREALFPLLRKQLDCLIVINIESWRRGVDRVIRDILSLEPDAVILDEAHRVKEMTSATAEGYFRLISNDIPILQMTGTPIQNRPQELFPLLNAARASLFPDAKSYKRDYCRPVRDEYGIVVPNRWQFKPGGLRHLMDRMSEFFVGRTPEDVGHKIPKPHIQPYELDFTGYPKQEEAYRLMAQQGLVEMGDKTLGMMSLLAIMTRQAQILSWPSGINFYERDEDGEIVATHVLDIRESVKVDWAEDFIKDLGEPVVLFSRFVGPLKELRNRLSDELRVGLVVGETDQLLRDKIVRDFDRKQDNPNPKYDVILATYDTIGDSVNLNRARHVILFDRYWKPAADDQAIGRVDRINSVEQALVHMPQVEDSFDIFMDELIDFKRGVLSEFKTARDIQTRLTDHLRKWA